MEKQENSQLELFSRSNNDYIPKQAPLNLPFFSYVREHEKIILIIIAFMLACIVSFSLGVEKGKTTLALKQDLPKQPPAQTEEVLPKIPDTAPEVKTEMTNGFTVQIASFKSVSGARKEAQALRKLGFNPIVLSKGNYTILCVGNFPTRKEAQAILSELKKRYADCYVRRL